MEKLDENKIRYNLYELSLELKLLKDALNVRAYDDRNDLIDDYLSKEDYYSLELIKLNLKEKIKSCKIMLSKEGE